MEIFDKFYNGIVSVIRGLFCLLVIVSLIAAIRYPEISFAKLSNFQFLIMIILIVGIILGMLSTKHKNYKIGLIGKILLVVGFILQFLAIKSSSFTVGYDVYSVFSLLNGKNMGFNEFYFSLNPNNIPVVIFYKSILKLFNLSATWTNLEYITTCFIDIGIIANLVSIRLIKKDSFNVALYFFSFFVLVFTFILVPYTDSLAYAIVSIYTCLYLLNKKIEKKKYNILISTFFLTFVVLGYFIKPSSVVPFIAIVIIEFLNFLKEPKKKIQLKGTIIYIIPILLSFMFFIGCSYVNKNQDLVNIQSDRDKPVTSFILIGMQGIGAYSPSEDQMMQKISTKKARNDYCIRQIKKQLKEYGLVGYVKFLLTVKQVYNTQDGMLGWTVDGVDSIPKHTSNFFQEYNYPIGKLFNMHRILAQLFWIITIALILFSMNYRDQKALLLQLAVLGGMLFLLFFEGGRTRYVIQFLAPMQLLAIYSYKDCIYKIREYISK